MTLRDVTNLQPVLLIRHKSQLVIIRFVFKTSVYPKSGKILKRVAPTIYLESATLAIIVTRITLSSFRIALLATNASSNMNKMRFIV